MPDRVDDRLSAVVENWFPRFIANGLDYLDVRRTLDGIAAWEDWAGAWEAAADRYVAAGEAAAADGHALTAARHRQRAAWTLQFAQFVLTDAPAERTRLHRRQCVLYAASAADLRPPALPYRLGTVAGPVRGYVRRPSTAVRPPVAVLLPGLESTKEQFGTYEPYLLERGVATVSFEGPGQGETRYDAPFTTAAYGRALDDLGRWLGDQPHLDAERVVVIGTSFGGHLALRHAAVLPGLRGVVDISGPFDLAWWDSMQPVLREGFTELVHGASEDDAAASLSDVTLEGLALEVPALVVHGGRDGVIPVEHAYRIADALGSTCTLHVEPEGSHSCNNLYTTVRPMVADWAADRLTRR